MDSHIVSRVTPQTVAWELMTTISSDNVIAIGGGRQVNLGLTALLLALVGFVERRIGSELNQQMHEDPADWLDRMGQCHRAT